MSYKLGDTCIFHRKWVSYHHKVVVEKLHMSRHCCMDRYICHDKRCAFIWLNESREFNYFCVKNVWHLSNVLKDKNIIQKTSKYLFPIEIFKQPWQQSKGKKGEGENRWKFNNVSVANNISKKVTLVRNLWYLWFKKVSFNSKLAFKNYFTSARWIWDAW